MNNILIPFDFSDISINAMQFGFNLYPNAKFRIVHVAYRGADLEKPSMQGKGMTQKMVLSESILNIVKANISDIIPIENIEIKIIGGGKIERILEQSENFADGIIMGTRDSYGMLDRWIGTVSLGVVKQAEVPVYLIPKYSKVTNFERVIVASDFHMNSKVHINNLIEWNEDHLAHLSFIHLNKDFDESFESEKEVILSEMFAEKEPDFSFEIVSKKIHEGPATLLSIAYNSKSDLIVIIPSKQNLLDTLFFKSFTKEIVLKSSIPLLFFPNNGFDEKNMLVTKEPYENKVS